MASVKKRKKRKKNNKYLRVTMNKSLIKLFYVAFKIYFTDTTDCYKSHYFMYHKRKT